MVHAQHAEWAQENFGRRWASDDKNPLGAMDHQYLIEAALDRLSTARAQESDANHFLYLVKAVQLFVTGHAATGHAATDHAATGQGQDPVAGLRNIKAKTLIIHTDEDLIFIPEEIRATATLIASTGTLVKLVEIEGTRGHLDGVLSIAQASSAIRSFLDE